MNCPNCQKEMRYKKEIHRILDLSGTADEDELYYSADTYTCPVCKIKSKNGKWDIPAKYKPTEKQVNTILFINNRLQTDFESLTKIQCWKTIKENFDKAKNTEPHHCWDNITDEDCTELGLDASMFC